VTLIDWAQARACYAGKEIIRTTRLKSSRATSPGGSRSSTGGGPSSGAQARINALLTPRLDIILGRHRYGFLFMEESFDVLTTTVDAVDGHHPTEVGDAGKDDHPCLLTCLLSF